MSASAFEEAGVAPELIRAVEELGWTLPTPIQAEAVPLILGGGDVMAAAETGSGKTGAFALPVLQIVHEALQAAQRGGGAAASTSAAAASPAACVLNVDDRDSIAAFAPDGLTCQARDEVPCPARNMLRLHPLPHNHSIVAVAPDGLTCQARDEVAWGGIRGAVGARAGRVYYEVTVSDEGLCRVGWAAASSTLDIGTDKQSFGYGGTGKKSHMRQFDDYGQPYGLHDTIGCLLDCTAGTISFSKNGVDLGAAFEVPQALKGRPLFPAITLKNAELTVNFGSKPLKHLPPGATPLVSAPAPDVVDWLAASAAAAGGGGGGRKPLAIILEPARDLAEQTHTNMLAFAKHLADPAVRAELFVGGTDPRSQQRALADGVDVVTGTPGRIMDFIEQGKLPTDAVKFFVLDEAGKRKQDRLLDTGNQDTILKMFRRFPKQGAGVARLQVLMFSATLHSPEVKALAAKICQNPIVVDLKGKDAVPETVDHVLVSVDPEEDRSWLQSLPATYTDNAHALDKVGPNETSQEAWSEATKRLKQRLLQRVVDAFQMDQAMVFCRTNFDCDNLERFLTEIGGGSAFKGKKESGKEGAYSCCVLGGARSMEERRRSLQAFKDGDVRFLICTDVAARGIDIQGLPFVINMTLPDRAEDYIHRVGRVGRADTMGLAISLVATKPEKVWYCTQKGLKPWLQPDAKNTRTNEQGGHTIWQDERQLLKDVEARLSRPIPALPADLTLPPEIAARITPGGGEKYGQQRGGGASAEVQERVQAVRPAVQALASLEYEAQRSFFMLKKRKWNSMAA